MKISITDKDTTIIEFTKAELDGCRLTYENIARDTARSREVLLTIMSEAATLSGHRTFSPGNTTMDILPDGEGGCVIVLRKESKTAESACLIFYCHGIDGVIDLYTAARELTGSLTLYRKNDIYYVAARGDEASVKMCREFLFLLSSDEADTLRLEEAAEKLGKLKEIFGSGASEE